MWLVSKKRRLAQQILNELNELSIKLSENDKKRVCDIAVDDALKTRIGDIDQYTLRKAIVNGAADALGKHVAAAIADELNISSFEVDDFRWHIGKPPIRLSTDTTYEKAAAYFNEAHNREAVRAAALAAVEIYEKYRDKVLEATGSLPDVLLTALLRKLDYMHARDLYVDERRKPSPGYSHERILQVLKITDDMIRNAFEKYYYGAKSGGNA